MKFRISCAVLAAIVACSGAAAQVAVKGGVVYTMAGAPIRDGVVVIEDGKITAVGPAASTPIPQGMRVLEAAVVTPGLIDARGTVGVSGIANQRQDQDQLERSSPVQPELRAIDAYNPHDELVDWLRSFGITTVHTGHAPGELISGQTAIFKTTGNTVEDAVVVEVASVAVTLSPWAQRGGGSPGTRGKMVSMLREELLRAREWLDKRDPKPQTAPSTPPAPEAPEGQTPSDAPAPSADEKKDEPPQDRNLRMEILARVLKRELPLVVTANRSQDIASVLRLAREFDIRVILDSAAEAYLMVDELKAANVPVIIHPTMFRAYGEMENMSFESASRLRAAGLTVAMSSGFESYVPKSRVVLLEAGVAAGYGLGLEGALATVTIDAAKVLGIDSRVGSLAVGKDGDVALYDGDPFEYLTRCVGVVIEGDVVSETRR